MPDNDAFGSNEDLLDEQSEHPLTLLDGGGVGLVAQPGEEALDVLGELEVGCAVHQLRREGVQLGAQAGLAGSQLGHPGARSSSRETNCSW